ncbi:MAG: hypothetical protein GX331_09320 [Firmicutes bacterium]|nr:hypothetical protein [Bacillota bacterium]
MAANNLQPSRRWYGAAGLIFVAGIGLFVFLLLSGISSSIEQLGDPMVMPGTVEIRLEETGIYTIYLERTRVMDGTLYESVNVSGLKCAVKNSDTGQIVEVSSPRINTNYSWRGRRGMSVFELEIETPGMYEISGYYELGEGPKAVLVVGKDFRQSLGRSILFSIGALIVTLVISITIVMGTMFKRADSYGSSFKRGRVS